MTFPLANTSSEHQVLYMNVLFLLSLVTSQWLTAKLQLKETWVIDAEPETDGFSLMRRLSLPWSLSLSSERCGAEASLDLEIVRGSWRHRLKVSWITGTRISLLLLLSRI